MKNDSRGSASITIDAPASTVWEALINPALIKQYLFGANAISDWKVGSSLAFEGEYEGKAYRDKGTILAKKTNKLLRYSYWSSISGTEDKPENYVTVTYDLSEKDHHTTLTISQTSLKENRMSEHSQENWNKVLAKLKEVVEHQLVGSH